MNELTLSMMHGEPTPCNTASPCTHSLFASFTACSQAFDEQPHLQLLKELLIHMYATPKRHHKCKPFCDHVLSFNVADDRIWFRNYQVGGGWLGCVMRADYS